LRAASSTLRFTIIEQPTDLPKFVAKTVEDYKARALAEAAREEAEKKKRADEALARKLKKELKDKESKLKMFKKLQEELGADASILNK
jgi:methionine salvage enolase-phosphatase E1